MLNYSDKKIITGSSVKTVLEEFKEGEENTVTSNLKAECEPES